MKLMENKNINYKKKKIVIICSLILVFVVGGVVFNFISDSNKVVQADDTTSKNESNEKDEKENKLDNSGYLELKDDPNADDAIEVARITQRLMKGEFHYPVRSDGKKVVYLTFDDGPSTTNTPKILDILKENDVKATFFVTGHSLENNDAKDILKREAKEGHAIANHSYSHKYEYLYPNRVINTERFMGEINKTNEKMKEILGKDFNTRTVRFPGGYWSWNGRTNVRKELDKGGYAIVDWNALNGDAEAQDRSADQLVSETKETVEKLGPNADNIVFLMHDTYRKESTVQALPEIIEYFKSKGYEFRTIK